VAHFPSKQFQGRQYEFEHLEPVRFSIPLNATATVHVALSVIFGCHCFTEAFETAKHREHHKYTYRGELRAFDTDRYECSLHLLKVIESMCQGRIYNADESYTYLAQITIPSLGKPQGYSVFFSLTKDKSVDAFALKMFVKSAYLKPLVAHKNAQSWRFVSLAGQIAGAFPKKKKKAKPEKKKAP
jgi:hypothetical protein